MLAMNEGFKIGKDSNGNQNQTCGTSLAFNIGIEITEVYKITTGKQWHRKPLE